MAKRRLENIMALYKANGNFVNQNNTETNCTSPALLDIGCAYGPFLVAARESGFSPTGIDPSEEAVRYVNNESGTRAIHGFFPEASKTLQDASFDVITLWFVIEHFRDCTQVFAEIRRLLKPGGMLAFATPSFSGVSGRASMENFLLKSPADHFTIWSPRVCKKALALAGFKVRKIIICGHHPERFKFAGKFAHFKILYVILLAASRLFGFGDTFEVYAVKNKKEIT
jgi:2-polyprenyl-3-methyl-5-hydroxy-6-metoxy-1,4-benzoquinol methylase